MLAPPRNWWKPLGRLERNWLLVAFIWCVIMTAMMPLWYFFGRQNVPATTYRVVPDGFVEEVNAFVEEYQVGEERGLPVVAPPPGDIYLLARQFQWYPILQLEKGQTYQLHLSSADVSHGFSLQPTNLNLMVLPGYDYVIQLTPTEAGDFNVICNEYCFYGHHTMIGKIIVTE